jgi:carbonic anhydrase/acetyltransferase-like protein (isoleucine patch superfamily)
MSLYDKTPNITSNIFIAPNASVIGNVNLAEKSSIWYGAVLRSEKNTIKIGNSSNVQDRSVITTSSDNVEIGNNVTIGHGALLNSCKVADNVLIGQGSIIEEGAVVESNSIIAAGAVVLSGTNVPSGQLWAGNPAKFVRSTTQEDKSGLVKSATAYVELASKHL